MRARLCALVLCVPVVSPAAPTLVYETNLIGDPPLQRPISITLDATTQELCVTDEGARTINIFDGEGHHRFRTDAMSAVSIPQDGSVDSEGGFVFTDIRDQRARTVSRLNFLGEPQRYDPEIPRESWSPVHLIITGDGHFVTLGRSALLAKHDANDGTLLWERQLVDPASERSDLLGRPAEAPDGSIYVPSAKDGAVLVISPDGQSLTSFGHRGVKPGEFAFPIGIAFAPGGLVLVLDQMKHKVIVLTADHDFLHEYGTVGFLPGSFYNPVAIAAAADGRVYVAQGYEGRIQVFRLTDVPSD